MRGAGVAVLVLAGGLGGCATLDRGTTDKLYILSDPPGAQATASFGATCLTPCNLDVKRGDEFTLAIAKAGFFSQTVSVKTRLNADGVGDLMEDVSSGGLGMVVDSATGATLEHFPNPVNVVLKATAPPRIAKGKRPSVS